MSNQSGRKPDLYALLIGVDFYLPNKLPDGNSYQSLAGCVRDITQVEEFLNKKLGILEERILKLKASDTGTIKPPEPHEQWPTYENMVAAFQQLTELARPNDQVYIHYSGHGGRTLTWFPALKGASGLDEALVPLDIGNSLARYLRDIEMAYILKKMVDKGLIVTLVLDSCHSGGATRGSSGTTARGLSTIDTTPRPKQQSLVASDEELATTWLMLGRTTRSLKLGSGWLPEPEGYVLLAACRSSELAYEYLFDGIQSNGALTYWLLDSLKQIGPGLTYKLLHDRIVAKVHSQFEKQTPQLEGEDSRVVFGSDQVQSQYAVNVMRVDLANQRVLLNTGQAQAVRKGAQFVIYPLSVTDFTQADKRLALVEVTELGATDSWANITKRLSSDPIEQAAQAVLINPGMIRLRRTVRMVRQDIVPLTIDQDTGLKQVESALLQFGCGFVLLAADNESSDYQVAVNANGEYEIWDSAGQSIANIRPALMIGDSGAAAHLVQRLVHLTKYRNIQQLDNSDPLSPLANKLIVELIGKQSDYDPMDHPEPQPFDDPGSTPTLKVGEWVILRVRNASSYVLNITALDLQPDWGITQIYPSSRDTYFWPFDPGQEQLIPLQAALPPNYLESADLVKVFATIGNTNFRWLELPTLDREIDRSASTRGKPANPLEELFAALTVVEPKTRNLNPVAFPSKEWATVQVEVRVKRIKY